MTCLNCGRALSAAEMAAQQDECDVCLRARVIEGMDDE